MIKGIYTAASGMLATHVAIDTMANNLANLSTVGFKSNGMSVQSFPEMLMSKMVNGESQDLGKIATGSQTYSTVVNFSAGQLHETGNVFDLALEDTSDTSGNGATDEGGVALFALEAPGNKTYYSRAGNFTVNGDGFLTSQDHACFVRNKGGSRIQLNLDQGPFTINEKGEITGKGNKLIDQIKVTRFKDDNTLLKVGDTMFEATPLSEEVQEGDRASFKIHQGFLEQSNANSVQELVNNIQGMRLYEALQKNIHIHNDMLGKAVNDVGRYRA